MKRISILEADRDYTMIFKDYPVNEHVSEIMKAEVEFGVNFKIAEIKGELTTEEKNHLYDILPKRSFKSWEKEMTEYYINRIYKILLDNIVRYTVDSGFEVNKKNIEERSIHGAKGVYEMCRPMLKEYIQTRFEKDLSKGVVIAKKKGDDIIFVTVESGVTILTPKSAMFWDTESGYTLFEFLVEVIAMNKGYVEYKKDGVSVVSVSDKQIYRELFQRAKEGKARLIIDLWGGWCEPCRLFEKAVMPYLKKNKDILLVKVNTDFNEWTRDILREYNSKGIPLVVLVANGEDYSIKGYYDEIISDDVAPFFGDGE